MKTTSLFLITTMMSAGLVSVSTTATAQDRFQQIRQERVQKFQARPRLAAPSVGGFVREQHARNTCGRGETKHLIIAGIEDNFATSGSEPATKSPRVALSTTVSFPDWGTGVGNSFDGRLVNRKIFSHLNLPANVRSGKFMIGLDPIGEILNTDGMNIGNLDKNMATHQNRVAFGYNGSSWNSSNGGAAMTKIGKNHVADFSNMKLLNGGNLENYYQTSGDTVLDVYVQDDHSVDYVAASVCTGPEKKGMTWGIRGPEPEPVNGVAHIGCHDSNSMSCEPYNGDTSCSTALPILCHNPMKLRKPANLNEGKWDKWSGGIVGTTNPMAAPTTLAQANAECVKEFGDGWRVAEHHDGFPNSSGWAFSAYGNVGTKGKRFWTDIRNQPNAVCWTR